jgi:hypothetical protein
MIHLELCISIRSCCDVPRPNHRTWSSHVVIPVKLKAKDASLCLRPRLVRRHEPPAFNGGFLLDYVNDYFRLPRRTVGPESIQTSDDQRDHDDVRCIDHRSSRLYMMVCKKDNYSIKCTTTSMKIDQFDSDVSQDARNRSTPLFLVFAAGSDDTHTGFVRFFVLHYSSVVPYFVFSPAHRVVYVVCCFHLYVASSGIFTSSLSACRSFRRGGHVRLSFSFPFKVQDPS